MQRFKGGKRKKVEARGKKGGGLREKEGLWLGRENEVHVVFLCEFINPKRQKSEIAAEYGHKSKFNIIRSNDIVSFLKTM